MKKILALLALVAFLGACTSSSSSESEAEETTTEEATSEATDDTMMETAADSLEVAVDSLAAEAEEAMDASSDQN